MRTDFNPIPRMEYGWRLLRLPYSILFILAFCSNRIYASSPACISEVNITLNDAGQAIIYPSMFIRGNASGYELEVMESTLSQPNMVDCSMVGKEVMVRVYNDTTQCMSLLNVEDKSVFKVEVFDTSISCLSLLDSIDIQSLFTVSDNCITKSDVDVSITDVLIRSYDTDPDSLRLYERHWRFSDGEDIVNAVSKILVRPFDIDEVIFPNDTMVFCPDDPTDISVTGTPSYQGLDLQALCSVMSSTQISQGIDQGCDTKVKYERLWVVTDWERDRMWIDTQLILLVDTLPKYLNVPDIVIESDIENCESSFIIPFPDTIGAGCSSFVPEYINAFVNGITVAIGDTYHMNEGDTAIISYTGRDDCYEPINGDVDTLIYTSSELPIIECPPAKVLAISLNDSLRNRIIKVASLINPGDIISCQSISILGRSLSGNCSPDSSYSEFVEFCLADTMDRVMVEIVVQNEQGLFSPTTCMVMVDVQYKEAIPDRIYPTCLDSLDVFLTDTTILFDPLSVFADRGNLAFGSLTGSGVALSGSGLPIFGATGSGFAFGASFTSFNSIVVDDGSNALNCDNVGSYNLQMAFINEVHADTFLCNVDLEVIDSAGICSDNVAVQILAYEYMPMSEVNIAMGSEVFSTDQDGIVQLSQAGEVTLSIDDDWMAGITVNDLYELEKILQGIVPTDMMYEVAGDVDGSGSISGLDFIQLKRLLLNGENKYLEDSAPWQFYTTGQRNQILHEGSISVKKGINTVYTAKRGDIDGDVLLNAGVRSDQDLLIERVDYPDHVILSMPSLIGNALDVTLELEGVEKVSMDYEESMWTYKDGTLRILSIADKTSSDLGDIEIEVIPSRIASDITVNSSAEKSSMLYDVEGHHSLSPKIYRKALSRDMHQLNQFYIYPNPGSKDRSVTLTWDGATKGAEADIEIEMFDLLGQLVLQNRLDVKSMKTTTSIDLNTSSIATGTYWIKIRQGEANRSIKYIKL